MSNCKNITAYRLAGHAKDLAVLVEDLRKCADSVDLMSDASVGKSKELIEIERFVTGGWGENEEFPAQMKTLVAVREMVIKAAHLHYSQVETIERLNKTISEQSGVVEELNQTVKDQADLIEGFKLRDKALCQRIEDLTYDGKKAKNKAVAGMGPNIICEYENCKECNG